ncbi:MULTISPECIES: potassium channel family protein [unclassified Leucobacter]|uniref:potassium channel family protein n=1 Tax=unclassified Leucobacter TaxID=2621730 RepID=UPI00165EB96B|nr:MULTISPECIES: potassium channel family protein [unclassified Leucobacter]MBC9927682.1 two pore domain potassium channel family protein [Leucobacter sp. cx-169]
MDPSTNRPEFTQLDFAGKLRVVLASILRVALILTGSFALYFLIPIDGFNAENPLAAWIRLSAVVLAFVGVLALQVRTVVAADVPQIRAVEAVVVSVVSFVLLFALLYLSISTSDASAFSEPMDRVDALYFTSSTFTTVGFGDIVATAMLTRGLVSLQMIAGLGVLWMVAKVAFFAAQQGLQRTQGEPEAE